MIDRVSSLEHETSLLLSLDPKPKLQKKTLLKRGACFFHRQVDFLVDNSHIYFT